MLTSGASELQAAADEPWLAELFDTHAPALLHYLSRRVGRETAEDLLSESFVVMASVGPRFDGERGGARAYLFGVATNLLRRHARDEAIRRRALARAYGPDERQEGHEDRVAEQIDAGDQVAALAEALDRLNSADRDVLLLVAWGGLTPKEAAAALGIPSGTARSRLNRVRQHLRAELSRTAREEQSR